MSGVIICDSSRNIKTIEHEHEHEEKHEHEHKEEHEHIHEKDPHIWTDPVNAEQMVKNILEDIIKLDENNKEYYINNANTYISKLKVLQEKYQQLSDEAIHKTIIFGGHFPFGYLTHRYGFKYITPYEGFSPNVEPSAKSITDAIIKSKKINAEYVFHEELVEPKVARTISEETGLQVVMLHGVHNLSEEEFKQNKDYISIMEENLEKLRKEMIR